MRIGLDMGVSRKFRRNLAHSAPLRTCFGWGVRRSDYPFDVAQDRLTIDN
jgi:hypothetical protein